MPKQQQLHILQTTISQDIVIVSELEHEFSKIRKLIKSIDDRCILAKLSSDRVAPRLLKIYELLMRCDSAKSIRWNSSNSFVISRHGISTKDQDHFRKVMQRLGFEKFAEFENTLTKDYQFKREQIDEHTMQYSHPNFRRHQSSILKKIKKTPKTKISTPSPNLPNRPSNTPEIAKLNMQKMKFAYTNLQGKVQQLKTIKGADVDMTDVLMKLISGTGKTNNPNAPTRDFYLCVLLFHHLQQSHEARDVISSRFAEDVEISNVLDENCGNYLTKMRCFLESQSF